MDSALRQPARERGPLTDLLSLAAWIALCWSAALSGIVFMPGEWYASLSKPAWNPPNWLFGPVWTTLYFAMGSAAWLVARTVRGRSALALFLTQLALNAAWTPVFFGLKQPGAALAIIIALWFAIVVLVAAFWRHSRAAALLLVPYLAWVSFAGALNYAIWRLN
jgi:benzodiazapine receptor